MVGLPNTKLILGPEVGQLLRGGLDQGLNPRDFLLPAIVDASPSSQLRKIFQRRPSQGQVTPARSKGVSESRAWRWMLQIRVDHVDGILKQPPRAAGIDKTLFTDQLRRVVCQGLDRSEAAFPVRDQVCLRLAIFFASSARRAAINKDRCNDRNYRPYRLNPRGPVVRFGHVNTAQADPQCADKHSRGGSPPCPQQVFGAISVHGRQAATAELL